MLFYPKNKGNNCKIAIQMKRVINVELYAFQHSIICLKIFSFCHMIGINVKDIRQL